MALENSVVLENLRKQLVELNTQYEQLATTRLKVMGAIDVLEQIEGSVEVIEPETEEKEPNNNNSKDIPDDGVEPEISQLVNVNKLPPHTVIN